MTGFSPLNSLSQFWLTIVVCDFVSHLALLIRLEQNKLGDRLYGNTPENSRSRLQRPTFATYIERRITLDLGRAI